MTKQPCLSDKHGCLVMHGDKIICKNQIWNDLSKRGFTPKTILAWDEILVLPHSLVNRDDWSDVTVTQKAGTHLNELAKSISQTLNVQNLGIDILTASIEEESDDSPTWVIEANTFPAINYSHSQPILNRIFPDLSSALIPIQVCICNNSLSAQDYQLIKNKLSSHQDAVLAVHYRLEKMFLSHQLGRDIREATRFRRYRHPRELLSDRSIHSIVFLFDWETFLSNGLPCRYVETATPLSDLSKEMRSSWDSFVISLEMNAESDQT